MKLTPAVVLNVLVQRFGLDGDPPRPLAEVAVVNGISRLEVRQIEGRFLRAVRGRTEAAQNAEATS